MLAAAACSSGGSAGSTGSGTGASTIRIGAICTCSGPLNQNPASRVYKAWVDRTNAAGGINGHPVQFLLEDDAANPGKSTTAAHDLVGKHVVAIVDMTNDDETWASYVAAAKIPVIGSGTSTTPMFTNPDFYPEGQTEQALFPSIVGSAKAAGATNLGLIYCAEAVQCQEGIAPLKQTGQALGLPVVYAGEVSATAPNYTAQCVAARQSNVSALFIADVTAVAEKVAANCAQQGYHPIYVVDGEILSNGFRSAPGLRDNLVSPSPNLPYFADSPAITAMNTALDRYAPGLRRNADDFTEIASEAWVSGLLFEAAAKAGGLGASGQPTAAELVTGLTSLNGETLGGMASPLTFAAGKAHPVGCWFLTELRNGAFSTPNGATPSCVTSK
ncbi:ABC transporter substrate-binding protein [Frankia sp. AgB32]|uniref:ABC transporter substrate-binding protein n=1 Tax=Frankia sp. AgB32 TaxID=631119 RepID=UPI00200C9BD9|nr:ABC transporter substrate-binding protein [Frankia sp. AgB32]MCK9896026.1 ABC transporter substrate-binding protein [Frankia sp. AgB32]